MPSISGAQNQPNLPLSFIRSAEVGQKGELGTVKGAQQEISQVKTPEENLAQVIDTGMATQATSAKELAGSLLQSAAPKEQWEGAVNDLKQEYQDYHEFVEKHGDWVSATKADPDTASRMQAKREKMIDSLVQVFNQKFAPELGIPKLTTAIFGTAGKNSDIDVGLRGAEAGKPMNTDQVVVARRLIESLHVEVTGSLPGEHGDTEIYIPLDYRGDRVQSEDAQAKMKTLSLGQAIKQAVSGLNDHPEQLAEFKEKELESSPPELRQVKEFLFQSAENTLAHKKALTQRQMVIESRGSHEGREAVTKMSDEAVAQEAGKIGKDNKWSEYSARWVSSLTNDFGTAEACGRLERKEAQIAEQLAKGEVSAEERARLAEKLDQTLLEREPLWMELNSDQAESLFSQEACKMTMGEEFGQQRARKRESYTDALGKAGRAIKGEKVVSGELFTDDKGKAIGLSKEEKSHLESLINQGRMMSNLVGTGGLKSHLQAKAVEQVREKMVPSFKSSGMTPGQMTIASQEVRAQMSHIHAQKPGDAVATAKYGERLARFDLAQLQKAKAQLQAGGNKVPPILEKKILETQTRVKNARQLERSKRQVQLTPAAAKHFLMQEIPAAAQKAGKRVDEEKLSKDLDRILDHFEPWGKHREAVMKHSEVVATIAKELKPYIDTSHQEGKIATGTLRAADPEIHQTLEAFAGYNAEVAHKGGKHVDLVPKLRQVGSITLQTLGLTTPERQDAYVVKDLQASRDIQSLLTRLGMGEAYDLNFAMEMSSFGNVVGNTVEARSTK